jgi:sporulation protein YlmC with PRC-barrel domain
MKTKFSTLTLAAVLATGALGANAPALAQVAGGTTTVDVNVTESIDFAMGWSAKRSLLGKVVYNDAGTRVGKVDDLIISPDKKVSYVIIGAGGFIGMGRHDVAVPVSQIQEKAGKLVMAGATKDTIKSLPKFAYANDETRRDQFVAAANKDIAKGKAKVADLEKQAGAAATEAKATINQQLTALQADVKSAEDKVGAMQRAAAANWRTFEVDVSAATARLRKQLGTATG